MDGKSQKIRREKRSWTSFIPDILQNYRLLLIHQGVNQQLQTIWEKLSMSRSVSFVSGNCYFSGRNCQKCQNSLNLPCMKTRFLPRLLASFFLLYSQLTVNSFGDGSCIRTFVNRNIQKAPMELTFLSIQHYCSPEQPAAFFPSGSYSMCFVKVTRLSYLCLVPGKGNLGGRNLP